MLSRKTIFLIAIVSVAVTPFIGTAAADTNVTSSTTYTGSEGGSQAVEVEVEFTPDVVTENLTATFRSTDDSFVVYRSFERTQPDGVSVSNPSSGRYVIDNLRPGQEVQFTFIAYPKTISQSSLDIATVTTESEQNPNSKRTTIPANMSASPYFTLQNKESTIEGLQTRIQTMQVGFYGGIALGVIGFIISGLMFRRTRSMVPESDVCEDLLSLRTRITGDSNKTLVEGELDNYGCDYDQGGIPGGGTATEITAENSLEDENGGVQSEQNDEETGGGDDGDGVGPIA